jgi:hypothetical protein
MVRPSPPSGRSLGYQIQELTHLLRRLDLTPTQAVHQWVENERKLSELRERVAGLLDQLDALRTRTGGFDEQLEHEYRAVQWVMRGHRKNRSH